MTYTINPNAKNVWIRDNEDTMDLSPITDASSVYLENGRTIEQELGEGSMVSNVATVDTSMTKVIDGTLDGAYESLVFKGKSLVNIHPISYTIGASGSTTTTFFAYKDVDKTKIKSGTRYFLRLLDTDPTVCRVYFKPCNVSTISFANINDKYAIFTTKSELTDSDFSNNKIHFYTNTGKTLEDVANTKIILCEYQEGMENWDIPYFTGICDVKMPILHNVGANLFDINQSYDHAYSLPEKYFVENNKLHFVNVGTYKNLCWWVKVNKGERIYCSCLEENNKGRIDVRFFSEKRVGNDFINRDSWQCDGTINSTICSDEWMLLMLNTSTDSGDFVFANISVSYHDTGYEDHKTNILHTPEEIVLRSLPNGVKDTYNVITGEYVKRIGEVVLDGSESWMMDIDVKDKTTVFYTEQIRSNSVGSDSKGDLLVCNSFREIGDVFNLKQNEVEGINLSVISILRINILKTKLTANTVEAFKQYLQQNPITVQYELVTPIITEVDPIGVPFAYENGHVILESGYEGQSLLPTLEYSTVVNKTGQIQSVAKTIVKQEEQLSSLEKMLTQSIIEVDYNNTLLTLNLEIDEVM